MVALELAPELDRLGKGGSGMKVGLAELMGEREQGQCCAFCLGTGRFNQKGIS